MDRYSYIKYLLSRQKIRHRTLAAELDVSRANITGVLNGNFKSRRVQEHIARRLGRDYHKLWGKAA